MADITQKIIEKIESLDSIEGRYEDLHCVNIDVNGSRKGVLSLVFTANDILNNEQVIIKFFDPLRQQESYRRDAFDREPLIISRLNKNNNCNLKLYGELSYVEILLNIEKLEVPISLKYFVTEFIPSEIDHYFYESHKFDTCTKLVAFRNIVIAVSAIHNSNVYHRDLKPDNIRNRACDNSTNVVIDFGTAAALEDPSLLEIKEYDKSVGAPGYSPPEAINGLSGHRELGCSSDIYALGCMLYELFHGDLFVNHVYERYEVISLSFGGITDLNNFEDRYHQWNKALDRVNTTNLFRYEYTFKNVEKGIRHLLIDLQKSMVCFDHRKRINNIESIIRKIDILLIILRNDNAYRRRKKLRAQYKENKLKKIRLRDNRIKGFVINSQRRLQNNA